MTQILPLAVSISEAAKLLGIGKTSVYAAISEGKLKTKKFGRRTLIEVEEIRRFLAAL
jgi:excisionase family DNA binding protein